MYTLYRFLDVMIFLNNLGHYAYLVGSFLKLTLENLLVVYNFIY